MLGIKRLITRFIAAVAVIAVALALLPSPAAADHGTKVERKENAVCGYSEDGDGKKYISKYKKKGERLVCASTDEELGTQSSTPPTIKSIFGSAPSHLRGNALRSWCSEKMFRNGHQLTHDSKPADPEMNSPYTGTSGNVVIFTNRPSLERAADDPVLYIGDLVVGVYFCSFDLF
ncbi:MAG: hypothetical protein F4Z53_09910 [Acidimicrobiales bacterium]|nr:hypothetical protein [Acidimicrobiales bacterium]MXX43349.1 hypothetical protein [Acidimicrobiales bacterium]MYB82664.1 hypothetical protein [Acidimicrobiales bacterium]MYD33340.1 hypothetical protein [Acidimicrobiales bacterium]MYI59814.1 hypothetical protein [Acidimicrobiaceae bacterium]